MSKGDNTRHFDRIRKKNKDIYETNKQSRGESSFEENKSEENPHCLEAWKHILTDMI